MAPCYLSTAVSTPWPGPSHLLALLSPFLQSLFTQNELHFSDVSSCVMSFCLWPGLSFSLCCIIRQTVYAIILGICISSMRIKAPWQQRSFLIYFWIPQKIKQCLVYSKCSINVCWISVPDNIRSLSSIWLQCPVFGPFHSCQTPNPILYSPS